MGSTSNDDSAQKDCGMFFSPLWNVFGMDSTNDIIYQKSPQRKVPISVTSATQYRSYLAEKNYPNTYAILNISRRPLHVVIMIDMGIKPIAKKQESLNKSALINAIETEKKNAVEQQTEIQKNAIQIINSIRLKLQENDYITIVTYDVGISIYPSITLDERGCADLDDILLNLRGKYIKIPISLSSVYDMAVSTILERRIDCDHYGFINILDANHSILPEPEAKIQSRSHSDEDLDKTLDPAVSNFLSMPGTEKQAKDQMISDVEIVLSKLERVRIYTIEIGNKQKNREFLLSLCKSWNQNPNNHYVQDKMKTDKEMDNSNHTVHDGMTFLTQNETIDDIVEHLDKSCRYWNISDEAKTPKLAPKMAFKFINKLQRLRKKTTTEEKTENSDNHHIERFRTISSINHSLKREIESSQEIPLRNSIACNEIKKVAQVIVQELTTFIVEQVSLTIRIKAPFGVNRIGNQILCKQIIAVGKKVKCLVPFENYKVELGTMDEKSFSQLLLLFFFPKGRIETELKPMLHNSDANSSPNFIPGMVNYDYNVIEIDLEYYDKNINEMVRIENYHKINFCTVKSPFKNSQKKKSSWKDKENPSSRYGFTKILVRNLVYEANELIEGKRYDEALAKLTFAETKGVLTWNETYHNKLDDFLIAHFHKRVSLLQKEIRKRSKIIERLKNESVFQNDNDSISQSSTSSDTPYSVLNEKHQSPKDRIRSTVYSISENQNDQDDVESDKEDSTLSSATETQYNSGDDGDSYTYASTIDTNVSKTEKDFSSDEEDELNESSISNLSMESTTLNAFSRDAKKQKSNSIESDHDRSISDSATSRLQSFAIVKFRQFFRKDSCESADTISEQQIVNI